MVLPASVSRWGLTPLTCRNCSPSGLMTLILPLIANSLRSEVQCYLAHPSRAFSHLADSLEVFRRGRGRREARRGARRSVSIGSPALEDRFMRVARFGMLLLSFASVF